MTAALTTVARGDGSLIADAHRAIVRDATAWRALWAAHAGPAGEAPAVDFDTVVIAAAFAGERPSPGFGIEIRSAPGPERRLLEVVEHSPAPGTMSAQMIVTPFHIVSLPRDGGEVAFRNSNFEVRSSQFEDRGSAAQDRSSTTEAGSSTGLEPTVAAALAYLAGPFSGALILLAERSSPFVTFHAWQSIVGLGGLGVLALGLLVAAFGGLIVSPFLFTLLYRLSALAAVAWLVAWAVGIIMAASGRRWKMPVVGSVAEKRSRR